jgi:hypothetical protein
LLERKEYDRFRVSPLDPAALRARDVERILKKVAAASGGRLKVEKFAESIEGRPIYLAKIGTGPKRVLLWSQMHGDEPTHTAVLLDLANYLLQKPAKPPLDQARKRQADDILTSCTLHFIPMLNPDGAEAVMRFNAQGIDINRDARRLATPEGRALRHAVELVKPEFAFNLHNQHARTSVGKPPKPAAVSVLAPAPDPSGHETPSWRRAKQMCAVFVEAVRPIVPGMISRYDDTHEPRAFGDTIQATGASTMLVEAGGWPDVDIEPLTRVHFHGMLTTLHAIATDNCGDADIKIYESLPESHPARLLDDMISDADVLTASTPDAFTADLGIEQSQNDRLGGRTKTDGKIIEIGDLSVLSAKSKLDAAGKLVMPGRIAFVEDWSPKDELPKGQTEGWLAEGITTIIGCVDLADRDAIDAIGTKRKLPLNWGFVGRIDKAGSSEGADRWERIAWAAHQGVLAIVSERADEKLWHQLDHLGLPLVQFNQLPILAVVDGSYRDTAKEIQKYYQLLNLYPARGHVGRDAIADLVMFDIGPKADVNKGFGADELARVIVAGETVWENDKRVGGNPGNFLRLS